MNNFKKLYKKNFDEVFAIMTESFPQYERRSYERQKALFEHPDYTVWGLYDEKLCAFLSQWKFDDFIFVEHFAVSSSLRGKGIGGRFFKEFISLSDKNIVLEVEPPVDVISEKRVAFYKKHGFFISDFAYEQPPMNEGDKPLRFMLMSDKELTEDAFSYYKRNIYEKVYAVK